MNTTCFIEGEKDEKDEDDPSTVTPLNNNASDSEDKYHYQRRRSRAVLYHLSGSFDPKKQNKAKSKLQLNKVREKANCSSIR